MHNNNIHLFRHEEQEQKNVTWYLVPSGASGTAAAISSAELSGRVTFLGMTLTVRSLGGGCDVG